MDLIKIELIYQEILDEKRKIRNSNIIIIFFMYSFSPRIPYLFKLSILISINNVLLYFPNPTVRKVFTSYGFPIFFLI